MENEPNTLFEALEQISALKELVQAQKEYTEKLEAAVYIHEMRVKVYKKAAVDLIMIAPKACIDVVVPDLVKGINYCAAQIGEHFPDVPNQSE